MKETSKWVRTTATVFIIGVIFYFLGRTLIQKWTDIPFERIRFNYLFLVLSYVFLFAFLLLHSLVWRFIIQGLGEQITLKKALQIIAVSRLGKYIPGKIWSVLGRVYLAKTEGIQEKNTVVSTMLETILLTLSSLLMFLGFFAFSLRDTLPFKIYLPILSIFLCFIVIHPFIFTKIVNFCLVRLKKAPVEYELTYGKILYFLILYCIMWGFQGVGFYFLIRSFYSVPTSSLLILLGIYPIAWVIGFLTLIVPAGIGIREGVLSYLLKFFLPVSIAIIAATLARIWITIGELLFFGAFAKGIKKYKGKGSQSFLL